METNTGLTQRRQGAKAQKRTKKDGEIETAKYAKYAKGELKHCPQIKANERRWRKRH